MKTEERIDIRIDAPRKRLIEQAATLTGQSLSSFAVSTLTNSAQEIVEKFGRTTLSDNDRDLFLSILDSDEEPNPRLRKAAEALQKVSV